MHSCDLLKIHYLCGDKYNVQKEDSHQDLLWFAQNSLPLRWQIQPPKFYRYGKIGCDLLKIHYLCGDKYNIVLRGQRKKPVVICSKFITFAVTNTTRHENSKDHNRLWFAQNSLPLRWQIQLVPLLALVLWCCDLLKIHYLCGDKYNMVDKQSDVVMVVICSKFITFAVTNTTVRKVKTESLELWFAQNSLPLRWQIQHESKLSWVPVVVICSKFITFAVTNTTTRHRQI